MVSLLHFTLIEDPLHHAGEAVARGAALSASPLEGFVVTVVLISCLSLLGGFIGMRYHKSASRAPSWMLFVFGGFLMIAVGLSLFAVHLIRNKETLMSPYPLVGYFLMGIIAVTAIVALLHVVMRRVGASHDDGGQGMRYRRILAPIIFLMLMVHETLEGFAVSEIFFETTVIVSIVFSFAQILFLAFHEVPEGIATVWPFLEMGRKKQAFAAMAVNQLVFIGAAIIAYLYVLNRYEPTIGLENAFALMPAGGLFALGAHEAFSAFRSRRKLAGRERVEAETSRSPRLLVAGLATLMLLMAVTLFIENRLVEARREGLVSGFEHDSETGALVPVRHAVPCEHVILFWHCLD